MYICVIWFLISSLSLGDRLAHKRGHVEEYDRFNKEIVHQDGKQDFYCITMRGQQTIKISKDVPLKCHKPHSVSQPRRPES